MALCVVVALIAVVCDHFGLIGVAVALNMHRLTL